MSGKLVNIDIVDSTDLTLFGVINESEKHLPRRHEEK
jgi:hypothetical protein